jgi:hypothetical protein
MTRVEFRFLRRAHGAHALGEGTIFSAGDGERRRLAVRETEYGGRRRSQNVREKPASKRRSYQASPIAAVMLHLRARYVSKAAILTVPASLMPVENRSPA